MNFSGIFQRQHAFGEIVIKKDAATLQIGSRHQ